MSYKQVVAQEVRVKKPSGGGDDEDYNQSHHHRHDPFQVLPTQDVVAGQTISAWTEDWWRWNVKQPLDNTANPDWDKNGAFEHHQPCGGMYFLAGSWGGDPAGGTVRTIGAEPGHHVPQWKPILVPLLNIISSQWQGDPPDFNDNSIAGWKADVKDIFLKIDGHDIKNLAADLVDTGSFSAGKAKPGTVGEYLSDPATGNVEVLKGSGYYAVVELAAGKHTIEFGGSTSAYSVHVIDNLTVR